MFRFNAKCNTQFSYKNPFTQHINVILSQNKSHKIIVTQMVRFGLKITIIEKSCKSFCIGCSTNNLVGI